MSSPLELLGRVAEALGATGARRAWRAIRQHYEQDGPGDAFITSTSLHDLVKSAAWSLEASGNLGAGRALEPLAARLLQLGAGVSHAKGGAGEDNGYAGALYVLLALQRTDCKQCANAGGGRLGPVARWTLYDAGDLLGVQMPSSFFEPRCLRQAESHHWRWLEEDYDDDIFSRLRLEDTNESALISRGDTSDLVRWFDVTSDMRETMVPHDLEEDLDLSPASTPAEQDKDIRQPTAGLDVGGFGMRLARISSKRRSIRDRRLSWDARSEAVKGGLSRLESLWMSTAMKVDRRARWTHQHGFGMFGGAGDSVQQLGYEWVRSAILCTRGVESRFFAIKRSRNMWRVIPRPIPHWTSATGHEGSNVLYGGGGGSRLNEDWAKFGTRFLNVRKISQSLLPNSGAQERASNASEERGVDLTLQAFGTALRDVLSAIDRDLAEISNWDAARGSRGPSPLRLWVESRSWAKVVTELAYICQCEEAAEPLPNGIAILQSLFDHCQQRQVSTCIWQVQPQAITGLACVPELVSHFLLQRTLEPYLRSIAQWAFSGDLQDPFREFVTEPSSHANARNRLTAPHFLHSMLEDANRSGWVLGMLSGTHWGREERASHTGNGLFRNESAPQHNLNFFDYADTKNYGFSFLPFSRAGSSTLPLPSLDCEPELYPKSQLVAASVNPAACISLRFSLRALQISMSDKYRFALTPGTVDSRTSPRLSSCGFRTPRTPRSKPRSPFVPAQSRGIRRTPTRVENSPSGAVVASAISFQREREADEQKRRRQQQLEFRHALDEQVEDRRQRRLAADVAARNEPPEVPLLESGYAGTPGVVAAAREQILKEHVAQQAQANAQAAYLQWRLKRLRLAEKRQQFFFQEMEALREELLMSAGKPQPQRAFGTWGPVVNPFDSFYRYSNQMLAEKASYRSTDHGSVRHQGVDAVARHDDQEQQLASTEASRPTMAEEATPRKHFERGQFEASQKEADLLSQAHAREHMQKSEGVMGAQESIFIPSQATLDNWDVKLVARVICRRIYDMAATDPPLSLSVMSQQNLDLGHDTDRTTPLRGQANHGMGIRPTVLEDIFDIEDENFDEMMVNDVAWAASTGAMPLEVSAERCLFRPMQFQARRVDAIIAQHFLDDLQILRLLNLMNSYILMGESRLLEPFIVEAIDRHAWITERQTNPGRPGNFRFSGLEGELNLLFQAMAQRPLESDDDIFLSKVHFVVPSITIGSAGAHQFLVSLRLDLDVQFPLSLAFSADVLELYSKLFRLFALVAYSLRCVTRSWQLIAKARFLPNWCLALRHNMHHFVLTLKRYLLMDVVAVEFGKMEVQIGRARSLSEILDAHMCFLETCVAKCFLDVGGEEAFSAIVSMLEQPVEFERRLSEVPTRTASTALLQKLRAVETTFVDMRRKLKLAPLPDGSSEGLGRFAGQDDFLEEWLAAWARRTYK